MVHRTKIIQLMKNYSLIIIKIIQLMNFTSAFLAYCKVSRLYWQTCKKAVKTGFKNMMQFTVTLMSNI